MASSLTSRELDDPELFAEEERRINADAQQLWQQPVSLRPTQIGELWAHIVRSLFALRDTYTQEMRQQCGVAAQDAPPPLRILVVGQWGVGKTSYVNTLCTVVNNDYRPYHLADSGTGASGESVTKHVECVRLRSLAVELVDLWGFEPNQPFDKHLEVIDGIITGDVRTGHRQGEEVQQEAEAEAEDAEPQADGDAAGDATIALHRARLAAVSRGIHSGILVFGADNIMQHESRSHGNATGLTPSEDMLSKYSDCIRKLQYAEVPLLSVLTRIDQVDSCLHRHPHRSYVSAGVRAALRVFSDVCSMPLCETYPVRNYGGDQQRNLYVEVMAMLPLMEAMQHALAAVRRRIRVHQAKYKTATTARK